MTAARDELIAAIRAGDSPEARRAIGALAELDDEAARGALAEALAGAGPLAALAVGALARHGARAVSHAIAATLDPARRAGGAAVLARIGDPSARPALRNLVEDPDPMVRMMVAAALYRAGERDPRLWSAWIQREGSMAVFAFLAAVAGGVDVDRGALDNLDAQAAYDGTPAEVRAGCAWAVAAHDAARGAALARALLADAEAGAALAAVVRRRGGPLAEVIGAAAGDPARDRTADSLGLPPA